MVEPGPGGLDGLNPQDPGIRLLADAIGEAGTAPAKLLLVHCGALPGLPGGATRLILDVRERTGALDRCVADVGRDEPGEPLPFDMGSYEAAVVWPRAHLGKDFSESCLALAALALAPGGALYCAARKQKGGKSLAKRARALLGEDAVEVIARSRGYHLWRGVRGPSFDEALAHELSCRTYTIRDEALGGIELGSRPGVFSRRELDGGTRALLGVAGAMLDHDRHAGLAPPRRILDLCAGIGPLALWAASRCEQAEVYAVESNLRACALIRRNAGRNGLGERVQVLEHDGLPELPQPADLALVNPPTHADSETLARLLDLRAALAPGGQALFVVSRPDRALRILSELGAELDGGERDGYFIIQARWARSGEVT